MIRKQKTADNIKKSPTTKHTINEKIFLSEFIVLNENDEKLGTMKKQEALRKAQEEDKDLVLIHWNKEKPNFSVCKIIGYGKFLYDLKKKEKNKKQEVTKTKELKINVNTSLNDINWRLDDALRWLGDKALVKITIKLLGRFASRPEMASEVLDKLMQLLTFKNNGTQPENKDVSDFITKQKIQAGTSNLQIVTQTALKKINPFTYEQIIVRK